MDETRVLGHFVAQTGAGDIPSSIRHEAQRAILNALGCAIGGCRDETVERALAAVLPFAGARRATLIGRSEKLDMPRMTRELGIAAKQAAGLTSMMGSMSKSYNMAHAASGGLCAALMARSGFTSSERALEAPRGFCCVLARNPKLAEITLRLGE